MFVVVWSSDPGAAVDAAETARLRPGRTLAEYISAKPAYSVAVVQTVGAARRRRRTGAVGILHVGTLADGIRIAQAMFQAAVQATL